MTGRPTLFNLVIGAMILLSATMAFAGGEAEVAVEQPEIYLASGYDAPITAMREVTDRFEEETGIVVDIEQMDWGALRSKWVLEATAGSGFFDIIRMSPAWIPEAVEGGWLEPLDDYIEATGYPIEAYSELAMSSLAMAPGYDEVWSLPMEPVVPVVAYRTDLFEDPGEKEAFEAEYGYELDIPTDMDQLLDIAEFFTRDTTGDGDIDLHGFAAVQAERRSVLWLSYPIWASGGALMDDPTREARFDTPETIEAFEWALRMQEFQPPDITAWDEGDQILPFQRGDVAMVRAHALFELAPMLDPEENPEHYDKVDFFALPPHPEHREDAYAAVAGGGLSIPSDSNHKDAAWEFISWVTTDQWALRTLASEGVLFATDFAFDDPQVQAEFDGLIPVYQQALNHSRSRPLVPESNTVQDAVVLAWHNIRENPDRLEEIVAETHAEIQRILDEGGE